MKHNILAVMVNVIALSLLGALLPTGAPFLVGAPFPLGILAAQPPHQASQQQLKLPSTPDAAAALPAGSFTNDDWHIETVDHFDLAWINKHSLQLDGQGQPHIAYGGEHLYYAWYTGTTWYTQTVDATPATGRDVSLALDSSGYAHIGYSSYNAGNLLKYAWYDGTSWNTEVVDRMGDGLSLALDPGTGQPRISYDYADLQSGTGGLRYAWRDATGWHTETVPSAVPSYSMDSSLVLDGTGRPHISYCDSNNLKYAWHNGTTWHIETVDSLAIGQRFQHSSLALDGTGRPHISYYSRLPDDLKYAWHDGTAWHVETITTLCGGLGLLALDKAGWPHISYRDSWYGDLKYAWHDGNAWRIETVDSTGGIYGASLVLDSLGQPHISYNHSEGLEEEIRYAWRTSTRALRKQVVPAGEVHVDNLLTYTLSLYNGNGSNVHLWDPLPATLHYVSGSLTSTLATPAVYSPTAHAISWQGLLLTSTVGSIRFQATPDITGTDSLLAQPSITNTAWLTDVESGQHVSSTAAVKVVPPPLGEWHVETITNREWWTSVHPSLALDGSGRPHISYSDSYNYNLMYARREAAAWLTETVDSQGGYSSLALDSADRPHISYIGDYPNYDFKYAWHDGTAWLTETVDNGQGDLYRYTSLALDGAGHPHISYSNDSNLKYAWHDGVTWQIETVDSLEEGSWWSTSLALDGMNRPHIIYVGHNILKYAWHEAAGYDGASWHIETVNSKGSVGAASLALDDAGLPHISYHWWSGNLSSLKYAWLDGNAWHIETVDNQDAVGHTSLELDNAGRPHISYDCYNRGPDTWIKYAWYEPFLLLRMHTALGGEVYNHQALTYTLVLTGAGVNAQVWDPLPEVLHYVTGSLSSTLSPPAVYSPTAHAITWQGELPGSMPTDRLGEIRFQAVVDIQGSGSLLETPIIANTAWLTDTRYGRIISSTAAIRVRFPRLFLSKAAAPLDGLTNRDMVTYTLTVSGAGQSATLWDPLPAGIHYVSGSLTSTLSPPAVYSPTAHAITWAGVLPADTLGQVRFQVTRGITGPGSLNLSLPIFNTAWLTDTDNSTHVEATVIVNGYRLYLPLLMRHM